MVRENIVKGADLWIATTATHVPVHTLAHGMEDAVNA